MIRSQFFMFVSFALCAACSATHADDGASGSQVGSPVQGSWPEGDEAPPCTDCDSTQVDCAAQDAAAKGDCDALLGYRFNGKVCEALIGCACGGASCEMLFDSQDACEKMYDACLPSGGSGGGSGGGDPVDDCKALSGELDALLEQARQCDPDSAAPFQCDGTFVPTTDGCEAPVRSGGSAATVKYKSTFAKYAASCYLGDPACSTGPVDCVIGKDGIGRCTVVPAGLEDPAKE